MKVLVLNGPNLGRLGTRQPPSIAPEVLRETAKQQQDKVAAAAAPAEVERVGGTGAEPPEVGERKPWAM